MTVIVQDKGLRRGAISFREATALGIASTAPAYSLAATVGVLIVAVGGTAPWLLFLAFLPVLGVALAMRELNRHEPDCGTVYAWTRRALGHKLGWLTGWAAIAACVLVMGNLAQVSAIYLLELFGIDSDNRLVQIAIGLAAIAVLAALTVRGIKISARTQAGMVTFEVVALLVFAVFAFLKADRVLPNLSLGGGQEGVGAAVLAAVFLYWGWDSAFSVNEESEDPQEIPARAAITSLIAVAVLYLVVALAALSYAGREKLASAEDDFFAVLVDDLLGTVGGKLLIAAVLLSALASMITTIVPTARTILSMAYKDQLPGVLCKIHPRYQTPARATWFMVGFSAVVYAVLLGLSEDVLADGIEATGLLIALYFATTALAVPAYFRKVGLEIHSVLWQIIVPVASGVFFTFLLVYSLVDGGLAPFVAAALAMLVGVVILALQKPHVEEF